MLMPALHIAFGQRVCGFSGRHANRFSTPSRTANAF